MEKSIRFLFFVLLLNSFQLLNAQVAFDTIPYLNTLAHIRLSAAIIFDSLHMNPGPHFYTVGIPDSGQYMYVYVSSRDSVHRVSPGRFYYYGIDPAPAIAKADSFEKAGFDAMVYHTSGTSGCTLTKHMLTYDMVSISFLMLHETMHLQLGKSGYHIAYDFEECIGDVVGNAYLKMLTGKESQRSVKRFIRVNEKVYKHINRCLNKDISNEKCEKKIHRIVSRKGTAFQKERYLYKVNNAYLVRFRDYTLHYFDLKKKFNEGNNLANSLRLCFGPSSYDKNHPAAKP